MRQKMIAIFAALVCAADMAVAAQPAFGEIRAGWRRVGGKVEFVCEAPKEFENVEF